MNGGRCPYVKPGVELKKNATAANTLGGSQSNMHLYYQAMNMPFTVPAKKGGN